MAVARQVANADHSIIRYLLTCLSLDDNAIKILCILFFSLFIGDFSYLDVFQVMMMSKVPIKQANTPEQVIFVVSIYSYNSLSDAESAG